MNFKVKNLKIPSMLHSTTFFLAFMLLTACQTKQVRMNEDLSNAPITLVIHGGAGTIRKGTLTPEQEQEYHTKLSEALNVGFEILSRGGKSVDAVVASITVLEDSPLFNAAKGAVFTDEGTNELDASIMDGSNLKAGAVAGVRTIKNPIRAAYAVMSESEHVMLSGSGADQFATEKALKLLTHLISGWRRGTSSSFGRSSLRK